MSAVPSGPAPRLDDEASSPFVAADQDFVDVLCRFLKTIPVYPDGHSRVVSVSERLHETAAALPEPVTIEVSDRGLLVQGTDRGELSAGEKGLRDALLATAVAGVVFQPDAPPASYVSFARALQRNSRLAANGRLAYADLWMSPIPGIETRELVFAVDGFAANAPALPPDGAPTPLGAAGGDVGGDSRVVVAGSIATPEGGSASDVGEPAGDGAKAVVRRLHTVSPELRELVEADPELAASIDELAVRLASAESPSTRRSTSGADLVEHLIRVLPLEARIDPVKGIKVLRRILERVLAGGDLPAVPGADDDLATRFFRILEHTFPRRERPTAELAAAADVPEVARDSTTFDELVFLDDSVLEGIEGRSGGPPPAPELSAGDGIREPASVALHALFEQPPGAPRDELASRVVAALRARPRGAPPTCLVDHLSDACGLAGAKADPARIGLLLGIAERAGCEIGGVLRAVPAATIAAIFPAGFGPWLLAGGRGGAVARALGRDAVLAVAEALAGPHGTLTDDVLERIASEKTTDMLPLLEAVLLVRPAARGRVARALKPLDHPSRAAVALRVVPEDRLSDAFLRILCEDGFARADTHRLDAEAAVALGRVVADEEGAFDLRSRTYATAALGSFPFALARGPLEAVAKRRLLGGAPKEVRGLAEEALRRFASAEIFGRATP